MQLKGKWKWHWNNARLYAVPYTDPQGLYICLGNSAICLIEKRFLNTLIKMETQLTRTYFCLQHIYGKTVCRFFFDRGYCRNLNRLRVFLGLIFNLKVNIQLHLWMFFYISINWVENSYYNYFKEINLHYSTKFSDTVVLKM